ncbi:hypothetical protein MPNT_40037 [Candidatus Methylacidithermus pantelleriae]|uniref:Uncharacterized protein n=1 Tax=Candidatus Methylacidithermus pantelleriae TaxID=2744239 RepID=A0A8J2BUV2_9BACT|nr:hypothetical protein MPNT_40037 [Candidatus Methylacidithermus pantelleriae]
MAFDAVPLFNEKNGELLRKKILVADAFSGHTPRRRPEEELVAVG